MQFSISYKKMAQILKNNDTRPGDPGALDRLFGGYDGYYWYGTLLAMIDPLDVTLTWNSSEEMIAAIQEYENETALEDEMKPQVPSQDNINALIKLLRD